MIEWLFYLLFFFLPLIFYPKTSEVFEFNKMVVVYIFTILIVAFWIIKIIQAKKIIFRRTILDIPLLVFLASQIISTITSIDVHTSIFGYYGRFDGGLLSSVCFAFLYWAFVSNIGQKSIKYIVYCILGSAGIVAIWGILEHFGLSISCVLIRGKFNDNCWVQDVRTRVFATLGQPNWLAATLVAVTPLALINVITQKTKNAKILYLVLSLLFFLCIIFTKSRSGLLGLGIAILIFGFFTFRKYFKELAIIGVLFLSVILIFGTDVTPSISQIISRQKVVQTVDTSEGGTDSFEIRKIVWQGAIQIFMHYPVFGTGIETFGYSYWQFRPVSHNLTSEWDFLYNKAHNEYLNYLANTGIFGLGSYVLLIVCSIWILRKKHALLAGFVSILVTNFFGFSVVEISLLAFLFPAIAVSLNGKIKTNNKRTKFNNDQKIFVVGVLVVAGFLIFNIGKYWLADYHYSLGQNEFALNNYEEAVRQVGQAISLSPDEAIYHNEMSRILGDTGSADLVPYAIDESDIAFGESPRNMDIRETRMSVYLELSAFDPQYKQLAIDLINDTIPLSPTDPKLPLLLGKTYANEGKIDLGISEIEKALELKPDYTDAKSALETLEKVKAKDVKS